MRCTVRNPRIRDPQRFEKEDRTMKNIDALAADIKRSIFNPPLDPHRDTAARIIAGNDLRDRWANYEWLCSEFEHLVQDINLNPDSVLRDLLLTSVDYRLAPITMPAATTLPEVRDAIVFVSNETATLKRRIATLKAAESDWARTPLDQRNRHILLGAICFFAQGPAPEHVSAVARAAETALGAGYVPPRDTEREKLHQIQQRETARALAPPMATGLVRQRGQPAAISHGVPDARHAKPLPVMPNAAVVGTAADAFMRGENIGHGGIVAVLDKLAGR
jgi:hypothetical protein